MIPFPRTPSRRWDPRTKKGGNRNDIPKCKADKQALPHLLVAIGHVLERLLLVVHFLVLGHVGLAAEVVKVAGVGLGVELGLERGALGPEVGPVHLGKVGVRVDLVDVGEARALGRDEPVLPQGARIRSLDVCVCVCVCDKGLEEGGRGGWEENGIG